MSSSRGDARSPRPRRAGALHDDVEPMAEAVGVDGARIDAVDLHAVALAEIGERLHERKLRADHRGADHVIGDRRAGADAGDGDDRAAGRLRAAAMPRGRAAPGRRISARSPPPNRRRSAGRNRRAGGTGVVDQDIEAAEALLREARQAARARPRRADRRRGFRRVRPSADGRRRRRRARSCRARSAAGRSPPRQAPARCPCRCRGSRRSPARPCLAVRSSSINRLRNEVDQSTASAKTRTIASDAAAATAGDGLAAMPRSIGAGLPPNPDHFGLVLVRGGIGASERQPRTSLQRNGVGLLAGVGCVGMMQLRHGAHATGFG